MANPTCPEDGTMMQRAVKPLTLTYKELSHTVDLPGWYCEICEEAIHSGEDMKISDRALNRLKAEHEGLLEPEQIRAIRKRLKLTQELAGVILGGGTRAFQKYEAGELLPSRAASNLLLILEQFPTSLEFLLKKKSIIHEPTRS